MLNRLIMKELVKLLVLDNNTPKVEIEESFKIISQKLLYNSHIVTCNGSYRILEIEFYFYNQNHLDSVTIKRKEEPGMWWLHEWGVDISFKSEKEYYGGILVRSLLNEKSGEYICGPKKCCWELFYSSAFVHQNTPFIEEKNYMGKPGSTKRYITGKNKGVDGDYRYYVQEIDKNAVKDYKESPW